MNLKYLLPIIFLALAITIGLNVKASPSINAVNITPANSTYTADNYIYVNFTANETLNSTLCEWNWAHNGSTQNMSMSNGTTIPSRNWFINITSIPDTPVAQWNNYTLYMENSTGTNASQGLYQVKIDTTTPVVEFIETQIYNFTNNTYENYIYLKANVSDNTTSSCTFRIYVENINKTNTYFPAAYMTLSSTNYTGTLTTDAVLRNCTVNITGSDLYSMVGANGVVTVEFYAIDNVNKSDVSSTNESFVFNNISRLGWTPIGVLGSGTTLAKFTNKAFLGNLSYVSLFNNKWDNKTFLTYRYGYGANNVTDIDNATYSGLFVYSPNGWKLIRKNDTHVLNVPIWSAYITINETKINCSANTDFIMSKIPLDSSYTPVVTNATIALNYTLNNATSGNITVHDSSRYNVSFNYEWGSARNPWNLVSVMKTNTTYALANQSANISYVAYYNSSTGYYYTMRKGYAWHENITVSKGEAIWVKIALNSTTYTVEMNNSAVTNNINVTWART